MSSIRDEFEARAAEIEGFFKLLEMLAGEEAEITFTDELGVRRVEPVSADAAKVVKAAGFLLLYNLVESTMTNGIGAIFDELKQKRIRFDSARKEIKTAAIRNLRRNGPDNAHNRVTDIAVDLLTVSFARDKLFSGNLDARKIREAAKEYGFDASTDPRVTKNGEVLLSVKANRNDLAHGDKSFAEVGREHNAQEMIGIKAELVSYLSEILRNIESYISQAGYIEPPPR